MGCDNIRQRVVPFMDDLLAEDEYQRVWGHLESCASCGQFAASVGTLSYRLKELGAVKVPHDLVQTIFYEMSQTEKSHKENDIAPLKGVSLVETPAIDVPVSKRSNFLLVSAILFLGISTVVFAGLYFRNRPLTSRPAQTVLQAPPSESVPSADQIQKNPASQVIEKIKTILYGTNDQELSLTEAQDEISNLKAVIREMESPSKSLADWMIDQRHYHLSYSSQSELLNLIHDLGLVLDHESQKFFIFYVPKIKMEEFTRRIGALSGVVADFNEENLKNEASDVSTKVSVYFV